MEPLRLKLRKPECTKCDLCKTTSNVCLIGDGKWPAKIMLIGEAPGKREEDINKPFAGRAGKFLDVILERLGLDREEVFISNIVKCRPPENRKPSMDEMRACRPYLMREIKNVDPEIIIVLGDSALKGLFDTNTLSIGSQRGRILDFEGKKVIVTYHPAAALRNPYFGTVMLKDLQAGLEKCKKPAKHDVISVKSHPKYTLVNSNNMKEAFRYLREAPVMSLDIETTGLDLFDRSKKLVSLNTSVRPNESYVWPASYVQKINEILQTKDLVVNHNIKFDMEWLEHQHGIVIKAPIFDTMVAKHLLDENYPDKDLKHLAVVELGMEELSNSSKEMQKHWKEGTQPTWELLTKYGGGDSDAAFRLYEMYSKALKEQGLGSLMETEMNVLKTLKDMELFGMKIDEKVHSKLSTEYKEKIDTQLKLIAKMVGEINLNSPKQMGELLYKRLRLPILNTTKTGAPSCDEATLLQLGELRNIPADKAKILKAILDYRSVAKLHTVYLEGIVKNGQIKDDGRLHPDFKICGTKTGRLSCAEPNLQNIPRNGDIKKMFVSAFKGGSLIQLDYSQVELRLLAHYANDEDLIQAFKEGRDIHTETTAKCLNKPYEKVTEEERKVVGKKVNFGIVYLIGPEGLASKIGCTPDKAKEYIKNWFGQFPGCKEWMNDRREMIIETGKSPSFNGRIRRLYGASTETGEGRAAIREGTNSPIQGGAGDITKMNMHRTNEALKKKGFRARVNCNVHDMIMTDAPPDELKEVLKLVSQVCSEAPIKLRVPLEFEIKVGPSWGEMKSLTKKEK